MLALAGFWAAKTATGSSGSPGLFCSAAQLPENLEGFPDAASADAIIGILIGNGDLQPAELVHHPADFRLEEVRLAGDAGLKNLAGLTKLTTLSLEDDNITDEGVKQLASLTQLETLKLKLNPITNVSIDVLKNLKGLKTLDLNNTQIDNKGLKQLRAALPQCKILAD